MNNIIEDEFLGILIDNYVVTKAIKSGNVGSVYLVQNNELEDIRAVKFISQEKVDAKPSW